MSRIIRNSVIVLVVIGFFAYCNYAFNKISESKYKNACKELEKTKEYYSIEREKMQERIKFEQAKIDKAQEVLLTMFPARSEDILAVFGGLELKTIEATGKASKEVAK